VIVDFTVFWVFELRIFLENTFLPFAVHMVTKIVTSNFRKDCFLLVLLKKNI